MTDFFYGFRLILFFPYFVTEKVAESSPTNLKDSQASLIIPGIFTWQLFRPLDISPMHHHPPNGQIRLQGYPPLWCNRLW